MKEARFKFLLDELFLSERLNSGDNNTKKKKFKCIPIIPFCKRQDKCDCRLIKNV